MDLGLSGKRVAVTGASRGIGRAIASAFLREGARVAVCARGADGLADALAELEDYGELHARTADLADPDAGAEFVDFAVESLGGLDVLVSNVSAFGARDFESSAAIDLVANERLIRAALGAMDDAADANVVCIGSRAGHVGIPWLAGYAAVKAATVSMCKSLALEVARRGIRVNCVSPGDIKFPGGAWERIGEEHPKLHDAVLRDIALRRFGTPEEIADVVVFCASPRASFMTGSNVLVDGGATTGLQL